MNPLQKHILKIAIYFTKICEENNLEYRLGGGTLLGAIRHNGFIPWDDDMDFEMPRQDYEKLIKILRKKSNSSYAIRSWEEEKYPWCFAKIDDTQTTIVLEPMEEYGLVGGIFIDIFPIDGTFNNLILRKIHLKFILKCIQLRQMALKKDTSSKSFLHFMIKSSPAFLFKGTILKNFIYFLMKLKKFEKSDYVGFLGWGKEECIIKKKCFLNYKEAFFEKNIFKICKNHDQYLSQLYGKDYMTPPKEEDRKSHHGLISLNFDLPYQKLENKKS